MKKQTVEVFHVLMKKGWIDRSENMDVWRYYEDPDVQEELETMKDGLCFELIRSGDRIYLVPTQDNDLFLKNNVDFRKDISASNEVRTRDLYLMNFSPYIFCICFIMAKERIPDAASSSPKKMQSKNSQITAEPV